MTDIVAWKITSNNLKELLQPYEFNFIPVSLDELSQYLPLGAYTTFRTYEKEKFLNLEAHINRLEETSNLLNCPISLNKRKLYTAIREAVRRFPHSESRIRITVDLSESIGDIYIALEPLILPPQSVYDYGVKVITCPLERHVPKAKVTNFIKTASETRQKVEKDIFEVLIVNREDKILEGLTSNFYAIKNDTLYTSKKDVLMGVTRAMVIEIAKIEGLPILFESIHLSEISYLQEAFLTSSSRAIVPIVEINGKKISDGLPGKYTSKLYRIYIEKVKSMVKSI